MNDKGSTANVTIDAASRSEAELIAAALPVAAEVQSWRGYGIVRVRLARPQQAEDLLPALEECVHQHKLAWARLRQGDDEWMLRGRRTQSA